MARPTQQAETTDIALDTLTAQYKWNPSDNEFINLTANLWGTWLEQRNPIRFKNWTNTTTSLGLPDNFKVGTDTGMWGGDVTNVSTITDPGLGSPLTLTYGATFRADDTKPSEYTRELEYIVPRDGSRQEVAGFGKASWEALDWLTLDAGLRYSHFWSQDRSLPTGNAEDESHGHELDVGGFSPSFGVTVKPVEGVQLFANYANVTRSPSLFESLTGFSSRYNPDLRPEHSSNWEIGANLMTEGLLAADDKAMIKLAYFNQDVKDYLGRQWTEFPSETGNYNYQTMWTYNLDRAKFSGLELSGRYEVGGFAAELGANYYLDVQFCKTADTCEDKSLYADYATNQVPPLYTIDLTLSQKLLDDKLTVGGRISHVGPRAIGHGETTAAGLSSFISVVNWEPYTTVDVFADYEITDELTASLRVDNLFDAYYVDPLGVVQQPAPGRTVSASITGHF